MTLKLLTFGDLSLRDAAGNRVATTLRKPLTVLAVVAASEPAGVSRDDLLLLLWPDSTPERGRQALSQALYALRQSLGFAPLSGTVVLHLDARVTSDVAALREALVRRDSVGARELLGGRFLAGVRVPGSPEFDQFVDRVQRSIDEQLTAVMLSTAREASQDRHADTVALWQQYAERALLDPLAIREAALAMQRAGNRTAGIQLLQRHIDGLSRELGLAPDAATLTLMRTLRAPTLSGDVDALKPTPGPITTPITAPVTTPVPPTPTPSGRPIVSRRMIGIGALVSVTVLGFLAASRSTEPPRPDTTAKRILVAPFEFGGDSAYRYLGTGVPDEIASRLASLPGLTIYPPSLIATPDNHAAVGVARRLNADFLLEGAVQTAITDGRPQVRVVSRLVSIADGRVVWTWATTRELAGVLQWQLAVADSAVRRISVAMATVSASGLEPPPTIDPVAFDLYLRALQYLRSGRDGLPEARAVLRQAVAKDSNFAVALARLGETQARMNWFGYDRDSMRMQDARRLIARSRDLAAGRSEPYLAMAQWLLADRRAYREAAAELDTALQLAHANVDALMTRANIYRRTGRWPDAAADYAEAARLDPGSYAVALEHGNTLMLMRRFDEARAALETAQILAPDAVDPVAWLAALAVRANGDTAKARQILDDAMEHVDEHYLVARVSQTFPELVRVLPTRLFSRVTELSLRDAYGDSALLQSLRAERSPVESRRLAHLDSAAALLTARIAREPSAFAAHRSLATLRLAQRQPQAAMRSAREALRWMPASTDVHAAMQSLAVLAQAEIAAGLRDSAQAHVRQLLSMPSVISPALLALDPAWRLGGGLERQEARPKDSK